MKYRNNGSFICDRCRTECKGGCHEKLSELLSGDLTHYSENKDFLVRSKTASMAKTEALNYQTLRTKLYH